MDLLSRGDFSRPLIFIILNLAGSGINKKDGIRIKIRKFCHNANNGAKTCFTTEKKMTGHHTILKFLSPSPTDAK